MLRLPLAVLSALLVAVSADAATITVNSTADSGTGTLRGAIASAVSGDTIIFSLPANSSIILTSGELLINKHLTISGPGANALMVQRSTAGGTPHFRIFDIAHGYFNVTISGLTVANGKSDDAGGGISNSGGDGTLAIVGCTVSGNTSSNIGTGGGGGIYSWNGNLAISDSTISSNVASTGGGILNVGGILTIIDSTISGNAASDGGGGILNLGGILTITDSTLSGNTASSGAIGGGIYNIGTLTITNSTISGNAASGGGGGIFDQGSGSGTVTITNSTISGNTAGSWEGGGILNQGSGGSTVTVINARNTIIAKNTAPNGPDVGGTLTSQDST